MTITDTLARFTRCMVTGEPQRSLDEWHSPAGGIFSLRGLEYDAGRVDRSRTDLMRYAPLLPLPTGAETLGTGWTPIHSTELFGRPILLKDERANPMGSFKDRGMCVLANLASDSAHSTSGEASPPNGKETPRRPVFVDSVGNTAAALAGFARALDLDAHVFAPLGTSPARADLVRELGAQLHLVAGPRAECGKVALSVVESGAVYLSHIYHPLFQAGTATCAFEIHEQLGPDAEGALRAWSAAVAAHRRPYAPLPDRIFLAVGQGSLFLGLWHGFRALLRAGEIDALPRLFAVRPQDPTTTIAVGSSSVAPLRAQETRNAASGTGGDILRVRESKLLEARAELDAHDVYTDPAGALALAGWLEVAEREGEAHDLVVITGADRERGSHA